MHARHNTSRRGLIELFNSSGILRAKEERRFLIGCEISRKDGSAKWKWGEMQLMERGAKCEVVSWSEGGKLALADYSVLGGHDEPGLMACERY